MKKILCMAITLAATALLLVGCANDAADTPAQTDALKEGAVAYQGLSAKGVTQESLESALGREIDGETTVEDNQLLYVNDVEFLGMTFTQLQCINYEDKTSITLTYTLGEDETVDSAEEALAKAVSEIYGEASEGTTSSDVKIYTWSATDGSQNYACMYANGKTELKLSFFLF